MTLLRFANDKVISYNTGIGPEEYFNMIDRVLKRWELIK